VQGALNRIAEAPEGAQAMVDADVFDVFPELLNSREAKVRKQTAEMLGKLAMHSFALNLILNSNLCTQLLSLLRRVEIPCLIMNSMLIIRQR
jgi:hypothetical protein